MHKGTHKSCGQAVLQIGNKLIVGGGLGRVSSFFFILRRNVFFFNSLECFGSDAGDTLGARCGDRRDALGDQAG